MVSFMQLNKVYLGVAVVVVLGLCLMYQRVKLSTALITEANNIEFHLYEATSSTLEVNVSQATTTETKMEVNASDRFREWDTHKNFFSYGKLLTEYDPTQDKLAKQIPFNNRRIPFHRFEKMFRADADTSPILNSYFEDKHNYCWRQSPIAIVSQQRSGTHWLSSLLSSHAGIALAPEIFRSSPEYLWQTHEGILNATYIHRYSPYGVVTKQVEEYIKRKMNVRNGFIVHYNQWVKLPFFSSLCRYVRRVMMTHIGDKSLRLAA
jgi:hypothetical protein